MVEQLFVYGTLAPGRPNEHVLSDVPGVWESATIRGDLVDRGWGAAAAFPAVVLRDNGPEVSGFMFQSEALAAHWGRLDEFEGDGYDRVLTDVTRMTGEVVPAWVYVARLAEEPSARPDDL